MSNAQELTQSTFENVVNDGVTLVDFWAEWCGPCRMMSPVLDQLAAEFEGKAKIAKVNVDHEEKLAVQYQVQSIPMLLVFKDGEVQKKFVGVTSKSDLADALNACL